VTVSLLAMTLTHYFALGTLAALAIYAMLRLRGRGRDHAVACFAVALAGWGILGGELVWRHLHNVGGGEAVAFRDDHGPGHAWRTLERFALLPVRYFTEPMSTSLAVAAIGAAAYLLALLLPRRRPQLSLWGLWLWLTIAPLAVLDLVRGTKHLEFVRYTLLASPAMYALLAGALPASSGKLRHLPPLLTALACAMALPAAYSTWWKADWRALAAVLDREARASDVIVFAAYES